MRVLNASTINRLCKDHPDAAAKLLEWFQWASDGQWRTPAELSCDKFRPSPLGTSRVVFDIGQHYRLICDVDYVHMKAFFLKWFGTHAEYDRVDAKSARNLI